MKENRRFQAHGVSEVALALSGPQARKLREYWGSYVYKVISKRSRRHRHWLATDIGLPVGAVDRILIWYASRRVALHLAATCSRDSWPAELVEPLSAVQAIIDEYQETVPHKERLARRDELGRPVAPKLTKREIARVTNLARRLKAEIGGYHLTAERVGIGVASLHGYCLGYRDPDIEVAIRLHRAAGEESEAQSLEKRRDNKKKEVARYARRKARRDSGEAEDSQGSS